MSQAEAGRGTSASVRHAIDGSCGTGVSQVEARRGAGASQAQAGCGGGGCVAGMSEATAVGRECCGSKSAATGCSDTSPAGQGKSLIHCYSMF